MLIGSAQVFAQNGLTYLNYNILEGLKSDSSLKADFVTWVKEIDPDIIALQETNKFTQRSLEVFASSYGHPYAVLAKESGYPVAITSKYPIVNVQKVLDNMWHGYLYANVLDYHLFVLHLSPFLQEKRNYEIAQILAHIRLFPKNAKIIVSGDFNAVSELDKHTHTATLIELMKESEATHAHIRNLKNGQIDYDVIRKVMDAGFVDVFYQRHKKFKSSLPTARYRTEKSFDRRIDFIFVSKNLSKKVVDADIIKDQYTDYLSDHYPVIMRLNQ